jgi:hypothetical protein
VRRDNACGPHHDASPERAQPDERSIIGVQSTGVAVDARNPVCGRKVVDRNAMWPTFRSAQWPMGLRSIRATECCATPVVNGPSYGRPRGPVRFSKLGSGPRLDTPFETISRSSSAGPLDPVGLHGCACKNRMAGVWGAGNVSDLTAQVMGSSWAPLRPGQQQAPRLIPISSAKTPGVRSRPREARLRRKSKHDSPRRSSETGATGWMTSLPEGRRSGDQGGKVVEAR